MTSPSYHTQSPPETPQVEQWLARLRSKNGVSEARRALLALTRRYPEETGLQDLLQWHDASWWQDITFGDIRMERRGPKHFEFLWSVVLNREFAANLKQIPGDITPRDLLHVLTQDEIGLVPRSRSIHWVVYQGDTPIGLSMFVNIHFKNRTAEQIMGILPGYDNSFNVADAYFSSLLFAYNCLGLNKVQGVIYNSNAKTALLQERFGFQREGVLREAVWNEDRQCYEDLIQISLLRREFDVNRFIQRYIDRYPRMPWLMQRQSWPQFPLRESPE
jgi:RimJ/RimL family protein N-acetyltransferase